MTQRAAEAWVLERLGVTGDGDISGRGGGIGEERVAWGYGRGRAILHITGYRFFRAHRF